MSAIVSIAAVDVAIAFMSGSHALDVAERAQLCRQGVSDCAIDHDPGREGGPIRATRVLLEERFFDFAGADEPEALFAYVAIARDWRGDASDMVAFDLGGRFAVRWLGREALLGAHHVLEPRFDEPLGIFPDPLAWLRGGRDGVVVLDWQRAAAELEGVTLAVDTVHFGRTARRRLTRPVPKIVVRRDVRRAAA